MLQSWAFRFLMFATSLAVSVDLGNLLAAETPTKPGAPAPTQGGPEKPSAEAAIRQSLTKNVSLWYREVPLQVVAEDLESKLGVPVRLDTKALKEAGEDGDSPVTFSISNVSARTAISLLLRKLDANPKLTAINAHEVLLITSSEVAESTLATKVYDVSDFADREDADDDQNDLKTLVDVITDCVEPRTWDQNGGSGAICSYTSAGIRALVVSQNQETLRQIDDLLEQLRSIRHARTVGAERRASQRQSRLAP